MSFNITCESSADLSKDLYKKYVDGVIPFSITQGSDTFYDGDIPTEQMYETFQKTKVLPKTSAINEFDYEKFFKEHLGKDGLIHFCISSKISSAYENAVKASKKFSNVYVIDSMSLSSGIGLQVIYANTLKDSGASITEVVDKINARRIDVKISFVIDTLTYLYKGGRCSALALLGANLLSIKPCIAVTDGKMNVAKKYMGKIHKAIEKYILDTLALYPNRDDTVCFITYSTATPEMLEIARKTLKENSSFKTILETRAGATVATHCGPNTLGIIFYTKEEK